VSQAVVRAVNVDPGEAGAVYLIRIEGGPPSNYSAWSPDLPGCATTGDTLEDVEREMREAIALHLAGVAEDGGPRIAERVRELRGQSSASGSQR
jgi:predicted RNase H-like HicB family nuclease